MIKRKQDSFSSLESYAFDSGKLRDCEGEQMAESGRDDQEDPVSPSPAEMQSSSSAVSVSTSTASLDLSTIWSEADPSEQSTSQEDEVYNDSLNEIEKLEQSLDQDMIGILNNQASVTLLRISAIQSFLRLQQDSSNNIQSPTTTRRKCLKQKDASQFSSMRNLRPKKSVRFQDFQLPKSAFSI